MNSAGVRLAALTKELWLQWQATKDSWHDTKSHEFEQKYMLELFSSVEKTGTVIEQLDKVITKIKKDCE